MAAASLRRLAAGVDRWHWLILALAAPFLLFPGADARRRRWRWWRRYGCRNG